MCSVLFSLRIKVGSVLSVRPFVGNADVYSNLSSRQHVLGELNKSMHLSNKLNRQ